MKGWITARTVHGRRLLFRSSEVAFAAELPAGDGRFDGNGVWQVQPARVSVVLRSGERGECVMQWDEFISALIEGDAAVAEDANTGRDRGTVGSDQ